MTVIYPDPFLEVRVQRLDTDAAMKALCAGYENKLPRTTGLADHLFNWIPYIGLTQEDQLALGSHNFLDLLSVAARHIYDTKKTASRGELGEILLHLACILEFGTTPVICKLALKSSANDIVKGYDGVHLLPVEDDFEIWLGESKFYKGNGTSAVTDAVASIADHFIAEFVSAEKAMIYGHITQNTPHYEELRRLFRRQTSGDELLKKAVFPVLICYESKSVKSFEALSDEYTLALGQEIKGLEDHFAKKCAEADISGVRFQLIFIPIDEKATLVERFDLKLAGSI